MDSDAIIELENYIFKAVKKEPRAVSVMAGIIGVLCDVKPTAAVDFSEDDLRDLDFYDLTGLFNKLGLKALFYDHFYYSCGKVEFVKDCYISKDIELAKQIREAFKELWSTMDDMGQIVESEKWETATRKIGELLGYPKTAIESFINDKNSEDEGRMEIMKRNRYYAHSIEHEEEEYEQFDLKINTAISKYAPKTASCMAKEEGKRWL